MKKKFSIAICAALVFGLSLSSFNAVTATTISHHRVPSVSLRTQVQITTAGVTPGSAQTVVLFSAQNFERMPLANMLEAVAIVNMEGREVERSAPVRNQIGVSSVTARHTTRPNFRQGITATGSGRVAFFNPWTESWSTTATVHGSGSAVVRTLPNEPDTIKPPVGREYLTAVWATNGNPGWAHIPEDREIRPNDISCDEWFDYLVERDKMPRYFDVLDDDFITVVGQFVINPHPTFEEMLAEVHEAGMPLPLNPTMEDYARAFSILPLLKMDVEYLAKLDGSEMPSLSEIRVDVETAGVRLPRMATDFEIMEAFVNLRAPEYLAQYGLEWKGYIVVENSELD